MVENVFIQGNCEDKFRDSIKKIFLYPDMYLDTIAQSSL